ncbi:hypothetical protein AMTR_s00004p00110000 [Amborella trichopoda]|uniref:Uncharacterized protein n=1 Tax=Amborella trichopoda TaxID=13333 RepID=W1NDI2_AMBTC|nr:hypothetical protein AMTR_s00004p00110000 [Amborella trichopoda]
MVAILIRKRKAKECPSSKPLPFYSRTIFVAEMFQKRIKARFPYWNLLSLSSKQELVQALREREKKP